MSIEGIEELLPGYVAGELSGREAELVEAALAESARLREEFSRYERVFVLLAAAASEKVRVPADLRARIVLHVALSAYLRAAVELAGELVGAYGRAVVYYLRLA